jgi:hypothetical protein
MKNVGEIIFGQHVGHRRQSKADLHFERCQANETCQL